MISALPFPFAPDGVRGSAATRSASAPTLDLSASWTYSYTLEKPPGTQLEGTETIKVESVQDINMGGFEYEAYRMSFSGSETFEADGYTGSTTFSGILFLRTADLALIKMEKISTSQMDSPQTTMVKELIETYQPPRKDYKFPLETGKSWDAHTHRTRHITKTVDDDPKSHVEEDDLSLKCGISKLENVTVGAGTLECYKVRRWNESDPQNYTQYWYSPEASFVAMEEVWIPGGGAPDKIGERELDEWSWNYPPTVVAPPPDITMEEDKTDDSVDLDDVFEDANGDPLTYGHEGANHIDVSISSGKVTLTPDDHWSGTETITLLASDGKSEINASTSLNVTVTPVDDPPNLTEGKVSPTSGTDQTLFVYSIVCADIEGDEPGTAEIIIDGTARGLDVPAGEDWIAGAVLEYETNLSTGQHEFYFYLESNGSLVRFPETGEITGPAVSPDDLPPVISDPSMTPTVGDTRTEFLFTVIYSDAEGTEAAYCHLVLDGETLPMSPGNGTSPTGREFTLSGPLVAGTHEHYFLCSDGTHEVRLPETGMYAGPEVSEWKNSPPELDDWDVEPSSGDPDTIFRFSVVITDTDGDEPEWVRIEIDGNEVDMERKKGEPGTGVEYWYETSLEAGEHSYSFLFFDGTDEVRYPQKDHLSILVDDKSTGEENDQSGSDTGIATYLMIGVVVIMLIIIIWLVLSRKKGGGEEFAEVYPVEEYEEERNEPEWD